MRNKLNKITEKEEKELEEILLTPDKENIPLDALVIQQAELKKEIEQEQKAVRIKEQKLYILRKEIAMLKCPFKIGDKLDVNGTIHFLRDITPDYGSGYQLYTSKAKKDGEAGARVTRLYYWDKDKMKIVV
jgi:hypothetical protein